VYTTLKFLHIFGAVLFVGNIITAALWKIRADRTADLATIAFAQRTVALADWVFTLPGILLVVIGGYGMAARRPWPLHGLPWLEWGQGLFWLAALIWFVVLVPTQRRLIVVSEPCCLCYTTSGRARRGASGSLYPQSATAGLNSRPRLHP